MHFSFIYSLELELYNKIAPLLQQTNFSNLFVPKNAK